MFRVDGRYYIPKIFMIIIKIKYGSRSSNKNIYHIPNVHLEGKVIPGIHLQQNINYLQYIFYEDTLWLRIAKVVFLYTTRCILSLYDPNNVLLGISVGICMDFNQIFQDPSNIMKFHKTPFTRGRYDRVAVPIIKRLHFWHTECHRGITLFSWSLGYVLMLPKS